MDTNEKAATHDDVDNLRTSISAVTKLHNAANDHEDIYAPNGSDMRGEDPHVRDDIDSSASRYTDDDIDVEDDVLIRSLASS